MKHAVLLLALAAALLPTVPAPAARAEEKKPPVIEIRPRRPDPAVAARERRRIEQAMPGWCADYRVAVRPLRAALDEADRSLRMAWGPWSRNVCFALRLELDAYTLIDLPEAPDPKIEVCLRRALLGLTEAAGACTRGLPTTTRLHLRPALHDLARVDAACPSRSQTRF